MPDAVVLHAALPILWRPSLSLLTLTSSTRIQALADATGKVVVLLQVCAHDPAVHGWRYCKLHHHITRCPCMSPPTSHLIQLPIATPWM